MEIAWLDFHLSTYNQNGPHLATKFFFPDFFFHNSSLNLVYIGF